jgi:hypothetical protein
MGAAESVSAQDEAQLDAVESDAPDANALAAEYAKSGRLVDTIDEDAPASAILDSSGTEALDVADVEALNMADADPVSISSLESTVLERPAAKPKTSVPLAIAGNIAVASWVPSDGTYSKGQRVKLSGTFVKDYLNEQEGVITAVGAGRSSGQLYVKIGRELVRIHSKNALVLAGDSEEAESARTTGRTTGRESRLSSGNVAGATFRAGQRVLLVGVASVRDGTQASGPKAFCAPLTIKCSPSMVPPPHVLQARTPSSRA